MDYITTKEVGKNWKISQRRVAKLCSDGRIDGAILMGKTWLVPIETKKPRDERRRSIKMTNTEGHR